MTCFRCHPAGMGDILFLRLKARPCLLSQPLPNLAYKYPPNLPLVPPLLWTVHSPVILPPVEAVGRVQIGSPGQGCEDGGGGLEWAGRLSWEGLYSELDTLVRITPAKIVRKNKIVEKLTIQAMVRVPNLPSVREVSVKPILSDCGLQIDSKDVCGHR